MDGLLLTTLIIYVTGLIVWMIIREATDDGSIYVLVLSYLGVWLFFPLLIFIPWVIYTHNQVGVWLLFIPVGLFLWFYGTLFLPKRRQASKSNCAISALSFNMQHSNGDENAFIRFVTADPPDLLALQEVSKSSVQTLNETITGCYPYHEYESSAGLAVYSQFLISDYKVYEAQTKSFQSIIIDMRGTSLHLVNAHLARIGIIRFFKTGSMDIIRNWAMVRSDQVGHIKRVIDEIDLPVIVACDANMTDLTKTYSQMTASLRDAYRQLGWGLGHTFLIPRGFEIQSKINLPFQRIDYFFHSIDLRVTGIRVISKDTGSDHRPLWAQFELTP